MTSHNSTVIAFDLYGTLLSTDSIAEQLATHFGNEEATELAALWRRFQLEYTWRLNSMNEFLPFTTVTSNALKHTLRASSLTLSDHDQSSLMESYKSLSPYPDVPAALESISRYPNTDLVIFTNGTRTAVTETLRSSPLSSHAHRFKDVVTVDTVRKYKPAPEVYFHLAESVGKDRESMEDMWLVSGNPFDVVGAKAVGMKAAWVDRSGAGWVDSLIEGKNERPDLIGKDLGKVVEGIEKVGRSE